MEATAKHFRKRDAILHCLRSTDVHPSAEWVYEQLKAEHSDISLATVYRNLARFKERGEIITVGTVHGTERFDGNTNPHVHFICTACGSVLDLHQIAVPEELTKSVSGIGQVNSCHLTFTGICNECINKEETA